MVDIGSVPNKKLRAMVSGHICVDLTPVIPYSVKKPIHEVLVPGTLVWVSGLNLALGGAVWNVGMALTKLGIPTSLNGLVGEDEFGTIIRNLLDTSGADCGLTVRPGTMTSFSIVLSVAGSDRIFLHAPGANNEFTSTDVRYELLADLDLFHFGYPPVMRNLFLDNGSELVRLFQKVKATGVTTSLDMAMPDPLAESGKVDWELLLKRVLPYVDIYAPSIEETLFMIDRPTYEHLREKAAGADMISVLDTGILDRIAQQLHSWGAKIVLLKCGHLGCYVSTKTLDSNFGRACPNDTANWSNRRIMEPCFRVEQVVSTTGAGDTTIAGFLASLLENKTLEQAMANATAVGALCTTTQDAVSGILPLKEVSKLIEQGWQKRSHGNETT